MAVIALEHFSLRYGETPVLQDLNVAIAAGECVLLTGPSACGKSSLLRALCGIVPYVYPAQLSGTLTVADCAPPHTPIHELGRRIGMIYQNPRMQFFCQTVREELAFARENAADAPAAIRRDLETYAEALGITALLPRNLWQLSSGERQRVAIAAALVDQTPILLFDEPTANLDAAGIAQLRALLPRLKAQGLTLLIAEHRLDFLRGIVDRVLQLRQGVLIADQRAEDFWRTQTLAPPLPLPPIAQDPKARLYYHAPPLPPLSCARGSITAVTGSNGSGKTTLLRTLAGLERSPYPVFWEGQKLTPKARRRHSFLVMQDLPRQLFAPRVDEEITLPLQNFSTARLTELLELFKLKPERHPQALSGGEQQRVLLAAALFSERQLCLLDEPTSGLDEVSAGQLIGELRKLAARGCVILVATHDPALIAAADFLYPLPQRPPVAL